MEGIAVIVVLLPGIAYHYVRAHLLVLLHCLWIQGQEGEAQLPARCQWPLPAVMIFRLHSPPALESPLLSPRQQEVEVRWPTAER